MKIVRPILWIMLGVTLALAVPRCRELLGRWECIQVLESPDRTHVARLYRLYGYIDVNFRITLNGKRVYWSPDCAPDDTIPFGETLAWDSTGAILVFRLAGETVFAYDVSSGAIVEPKVFATIRVPAVTLDRIGFEGRQLLREQTRGNVQRSTEGDSPKATPQD